MEGEATVSVLDQVISGVPKVFELGTTCFNAIIDNPILLLFFSVGMIGTGLGVFKKLKRAARG